jgi:hypothetical protein
MRFKIAPDMPKQIIISKILITFFALISLLESCKQSKKLNNPNDLGREIFELLKRQEREKVILYLISKKEIKIAFTNSPQFNSLNESQKKNL